MLKVLIAIAGCCAALVFAPLASAQQVYKCKDAGGKTIYSQTPCASLSDPSQVRMSTQSGSGSFAGSSSTKSEPVVKSATAKPKAEEKKAEAPQGEASSESAKDFQKRANRCELLKREAAVHEAKLKGGAQAAEFETAKKAKEANWSEQTKERCGEIK